MRHGGASIVIVAEIAGRQWMSAAWVHLGCVVLCGRRRGTRTTAGRCSPSDWPPKQIPPDHAEEKKRAVLLWPSKAGLHISF